MTAATIPLHDTASNGEPRQSLMIGAGWAALGTVGSRVILLAGMIVAARALGKSVFGQLAMVQQTVMLFSIVISYGLGLTGAKYLAELRELDRGRAGRYRRGDLGGRQVRHPGGESLLPEGATDGPPDRDRPVGGAGGALDREEAGRIA